MSPPPSPEWAVKTLSALDLISGWTFFALAGVLAFLLFSPYTLGIDLTHIRLNYAAWMFAAMAIFTALTAAKFLRYAQQSIKFGGKKPKNFILTQQPMKCWWHIAKQPDESYVTQIVCDCDVLNLTPQGLRFHSVRLISPRLRKGEVLHSEIGLFNALNLGRDYVLPSTTEWVRLSIMIREKLGKESKSLKILVGITDSHGMEQRIKLKLRNS